MSERDELVARLRGWDHCWPARWLETAVAAAADQIERDGREIEKLTAENERLKYVLEGGCGSNRHWPQRTDHGLAGSDQHRPRRPERGGRGVTPEEMIWNAAIDAAITKYKDGIAAIAALKKRPKVTVEGECESRANRLDG